MGDESKIKTDTPKPGRPVKDTQLSEPPRRMDEDVSLLVEKRKVRKQSTKGTKGPKK